MTPLSTHSSGSQLISRNLSSVMCMETIKPWKYSREDRKGRLQGRTASPSRWANQDNSWHTPSCRENTVNLIHKLKTPVAQCSSQPNLTTQEIMKILCVNPKAILVTDSHLITMKLEDRLWRSPPSSWKRSKWLGSISRNLDIPCVLLSMSLFFPLPRRMRCVWPSQRRRTFH